MMSHRVGTSLLPPRRDRWTPDDLPHHDTGAFCAALRAPRPSGSCAPGLWCLKSHNKLVLRQKKRFVLVTCSMQLESSTAGPFESLHIKTMPGSSTLGAILSKQLTDASAKSVYVHIPEEVATPNAFKSLKREDFQFYRYDSNVRGFVYYKWLSDGPSKVPAACTSILGAQIIVRSPSGRNVLMISEPTAGTIVWKLPQGGIDLGEDIVDGALREAVEETGVRLPANPVVRLVGGYTQANARPGGIGNQMACIDVRASDDALGTSDGEALQVRWMSRRRLGALYASARSSNTRDADHHFKARIVTDAGEAFQLLSLHYISLPRARHMPIRLYSQTRTRVFNA
jgi:8-oxo-dGTP pyrophosphatase MutT (NUDIX family)